jgi:hypothetical protein
MLETKIKPTYRTPLIHFLIINPFFIPLIRNFPLKHVKKEMVIVLIIYNIARVFADFKFLIVNHSPTAASHIKSTFKL